MKPYYDQDGITIYHGDCKEVLSDLPPIDIVLTDPPYGINYQSNHHKGLKFDKLQGDGIYPVETLKDLIRLSRNAVYAFTRWDMLWKLPTPKSFIVWVKNNWGMGDLQHEYARQWEGCAFYANSGHEWTDGRPQDVLIVDRVGSGQLKHPTEKPIVLLEKLLIQCQGDMVLDPFMGSGSTLRAAKNLNKKAIGIEIEEKYCELAAERMAQGVLF